MLKATPKLSSEPATTPATTPGQPGAAAGATVPLSLHKATGQYYKKIRGRRYYFGTDPEEAYRRWILEGPSLQADERPTGMRQDDMTIETLARLYKARQEGEAKLGNIEADQCYYTDWHVSRFVRWIGPTRLVCHVETKDLLDYRLSLINEGKQPNTVNNYMAPVKAMFRWALIGEVIQKGPNLEAVPKRVPKAQRHKKRQTFTAEQIWALIAAAPENLQAMILLGINCGLGVTDCALIKWDNIDLEKGTVDYPRHKTGVERFFTLWPQTVEALRRQPRLGELVFYTSQGQPWVRVCQGEKKSPDRALVKEFKKLLVKVKTPRQKGTGFYTLRRTGATKLAETGDAFAVQGYLGHTTVQQASTYVQDNKPQTQRALRHAQQWLTQAIKDAVTAAN